MFFILYYPPDLILTCAETFKQALENLGRKRRTNDQCVSVGEWRQNNQVDEVLKGLFECFCTHED